MTPEQIERTEFALEVCLGGCCSAEVTELTDQLQADANRLADLDTLDAHVRTLTGDSHWYSNDDTCGVYIGGHAELSWHHHAPDENAARHSVAEHIRSTPRCEVRHPGFGRCVYLAGHPGEQHTYRVDEPDTTTKSA